MSEFSVGNVFVPDIEVSRLKAAGETELALILELLCDFHDGETIQARQHADLPEFLTSIKVHAFGFYTLLVRELLLLHNLLEMIR